MQQIDHGPKVPAFFDVHLKKVAQIVKRRTRLAELSLLFDGRGFGVALRDDDSSQRIAKLAGHFLICRLSVVVAEADLGVGLRWFEKDAPTIIGHLHVIEVRPSFGADVNRGAQPHVFFLKTFRSHLAPPVEIVWQPLLQRALKLLVFGEIYVVRNAIV